MYVLCLASLVYFICGFFFFFLFLLQQSFEESVPDKVPQPKSDSELRQTFGITADLIVSLQKIDVSKELQAQSEKRLINKRTLDGIRKMIHDSKIETKLKQLIQTQVRFFLCLRLVSISVKSLYLKVFYAF